MLFVCRCALGDRVWQPVCQPADVPWRALVTARTLAGMTLTISEGQRDLQHRIDHTGVPDGSDLKQLVRDGRQLSREDVELCELYRGSFSNYDLFRASRTW
jgi:hypothetical protein